LALATINELIKAGVHFGHYASRWNPKMKPYIYGKRNLIHIIDVKETLKGLIKARAFLRNLARSGEEVLFVGTKRQARDIVMRHAQRCGMHYVVERWLGGTLTNHATIRQSLQRLGEIEQYEETGIIHKMSKKAVSQIMREKRKLLRNLSGIRNMAKLPGTLVVIDPHHEDISVLEARKLGIPTVCLLDTDSDPELVDVPIPGNDDALRSIELVMTFLADAVLAGVEERPVAPSPAPRAAPAVSKTRDSGRETAPAGGAADAPVVTKAPAADADAPVVTKAPAADTAPTPSDTASVAQAPAGETPADAGVGTPGSQEG